MMILEHAAPTDEPRQPLPPSTCLRLGVLVSGRGSNLQALLDAASDPAFPAQVVAVASNKPGVFALKRAERAGVPARTFAREDFPTRRARDEAIAEYLSQAKTDLVVLAGYDRVLAPSVIAAFRDRIINIHPSLLPAFAGTLHAPAEALRHGVKVTGCSVHFVTDDLDAGPIILQRVVPVHDEDTEESLAARILEEEHRALPEAVRLLAAGRILLEGCRARTLPER